MAFIQRYTQRLTDLLTILSNYVRANQTRTDPRLHKDDVDIKFSRALNSCKLPQIRYASKERLFERLTDLRFLSIDFLNTFLLTYRVFTSAEDVLEALKSVHYSGERLPGPLQLQHEGAQRASCMASQQQRAVSIQQRDSMFSMNSASCQPLSRSQQHISSCASSPVVNSPSASQAVHEQSVASSSKPIGKQQVQQQQQQQPNSQVMQQSLQDTSWSVDKKGASVKPVPPHVPPRSPHASRETLTADPHQQQQHQKIQQAQQKCMLLAPQNQYNKRRSTISALTPITGSTSSSLVNLSKAGQQQQVARRQRGSSSSAAVCASDCEQEHEHELGIDESELAEFADADGPAQLHTSDGSPALPAQQVGSSRQKFAPPPPPPKCPQRLAVPGARQTRAHSFSLTGASSEATQQQVARIQTGSDWSGDHWRLSYKRSTGQLEQARAPAVSPRLGAAEQLQASQANRQNATSSGALNLLAPIAPARRKSAADVEFRLTPAEPAAELEAAARSEREVATSEPQDELLPSHGPSSPLADAQTPLVPPSTPVVGLLSGGASSCHLAPKSDHLRPSKQQRRRRRHSKRAQVAASPMSSNEASMCSSLADIANSSSIDDEFDSGQAQSADLLAVSSNSSLDEQEQYLLESDSAPRLDQQQQQRQTKLARHHKQLRAAHKQRQESLMLKEIDLTTQATAKLLDYDTSADDSEQTHSSSSAEQQVPTKADCAGRARTRCSLNANSSSEQHELAQKDTFAEAQLRQPAERAGLERQYQASQQAAIALKTSAKLAQELGAPQPAEQHQQQVGASRRVGAASASCLNTPRSSFQHSSNAEGLLNSRAGVVVTSKSPRVSSRRSSTASAASAFAAATAASCNPLLTQPPAELLSAAPGQLRALGCRSPNELGVVDQLHCTCGAATSAIHSNSMTQLHRGSISSIQQQHHRRTTGAPLHGQAQHHSPNCQLTQLAQHHTHQQLNQFSYQSDLSSVSLCNSRASSRLSSCAGLVEFAPAPTSGHQLQQQQQQLHRPTRAGSSQLIGGQAVQSFARFAGSQSNLGYQQQLQQQQLLFGSNIHNHTSSAQPHQLAAKKRNSSASAQNNIRSMATLRVLSVLRHWVSKHSQDFINDSKLAYQAQEFLQDLIMDTSLLPAEHKAAIQLQQMVQKATHSRSTQVDLDVLLAPPAKASPDSIETLSALEIAEGMTYLDHKIFLAIKSEEFLGQAWMKTDKAIKAPHILLITKRFNDVSRLVSSEIIRVPELHRRVAIIEKWTNVAHICRVIHNFNGVLQICAAFTNSAVFRLKKTWDKIPKTTKATIDQLQNLVSTDSRFRNMRDAINRCDPPSIPYVGMYLTDLSFIEEGTPNYSPEGLLNFSKMRMIAHVIREIQHLQNGVYKMDLNPRVANYLLDASRHLQDDEMYRCSLAIEPRSSNAKNGVQLLASTGSTQHVNQQGTTQASPGHQVSTTDSSGASSATAAATSTSVVFQ